MLRWLAIFAVFFAVTQAPVPTSGQTPNHPANAGGSVQGNGKTDKKPSAPPPPIIQPVQATKEQYDGSTEAGENKPQPVAIRDFPTVSVRKDWADKSYWLFSGLLVIVGGFQVFLLWRTLGAIKRQAVTMEKSAQNAVADAAAAAVTTQETLAAIKRQADTLEGQTEAALRQIRDTKNRERARLALHPKTITEIVVNDLYPMIDLEIENVGYSHAFNLRIEARCEITASLTEPEGGEMQSVAVSIVQVGGERSQTSIALSYDEEVVCAGAKNLYAHLWGSGTYDDVYGDSYPLSFRYFMDIQRILELQQKNGIMILPVMALFGWEENPER
jgi:hypothetical protein